MKDFFASLYEWFGLVPFYVSDLGDHLRGFDITCSDFIGTPWYLYIGCSMIITTIIIYALQYHIIDSPRLNKRRHWWLVALIIIAINFITAFAIPYNSLQTGDLCQDLHFSVADCLGFGLSNALWSLILFVIITTIPWIRQLGVNCRHTTFWKP